MSEMNGMDMSGHVDWDSAPDAVKLRAAADGELPAEHEAALRASLGDGRVSGGVAFERALRDRVGSVMTESSAPEGLRERLRSAMAADDDAGGEGVVISRRDRSFWSGGGPLLGLAAALALAATVWVLAPSGGPAGTPFDGVLAQAAAGLVEEHSGCLKDPAHFEVSGAEAGVDPDRYISQRIGDLPVNLLLGDEGFRLSGVGDCSIPTGGDAVHLLYEPDDSSMKPVSLFVQNASDASVSMDEGTLYTSQERGSPYVRAWRNGGVVYYLVTECPVSCSTAERAYALGGERVGL